ncbi:MAG: tetratricopeptide repeat protein [Gemmatimonadota bacterium]|jgi:predicted negative regulator of RcsB-dependent stress response|nr:tetratricopeptide repeat protein [Gemmatimonadota bacterium]
MVAQSTTRRPGRTSQIDGDDAVLARALEVTEWVKRNSGIVLGALAALLVLVAIFFWYRADRNRRLDDAAIAYLQVEQSAQIGDEATAARDLQEFIQRHDGTPYADEARVLLGQIQLRAGRAQEAIPVLQPVAEKLNGSLVGPQAALLLATARATTGDAPGAIEAYLRVANQSDSQFRQTEGLMGAALLRSEGGDHAGAAELYRRLVDMQEAGSADRSLFEMRLAEEEALAGR